MISLSSLGSVGAKGLKLVSFCHAIPHPEKAYFGGEDSHFISKNGKVVGVADGVGGWATVPGGNSAKYSRDLMRFADENSNLRSSLEILDAAFEKMDKTIKGSTTATVVRIDDEMLDILNVGDSGAAIYRSGKKVFQTTPTLHGFNFPMQLGMHSKTRPADGTKEKFLAKPDDVLICATDGVWDNIWEEEIQKMVSKSSSEWKVPDDLAFNLSKLIAKSAAENGKKPKWMSPFAEEARKHGYYYDGGKLDDVTALVSVIAK